MSVTFQELDGVRVVRLAVPSREVDGSGAEPSQPRVGESGTVVQCLGDDLYLVERGTDDGFTIWLAEFHASELEPVDGPSRVRPNGDSPA